MSDSESLQEILDSPVPLPVINFGLFRQLSPTSMVSPEWQILRLGLGIGTYWGPPGAWDMVRTKMTQALQSLTTSPCAIHASADTISLAHGIAVAPGWELPGPPRS